MLMNAILVVSLSTYGVLLLLVMLFLVARRFVPSAAQKPAEREANSLFVAFKEQDIVEAYTLNKGWSQLESKPEFWLEDNQEQLLQSCCEIQLELFRQKGLLPNPAHFGLLVQQLRKKGAAERARSFLTAYKEAVDAYYALILRSGRKFDRPFMPIMRNSEGLTLLAAYAEEFKVPVDEVLPWKKATSAKRNNSQEQAVDKKDSSAAGQVASGAGEIPSPGQAA